jgi:hypothetical protein
MDYGALMRRKASLLQVRVRKKARRGVAATGRAAPFLTAIATIGLAATTVYLATITKDVAKQTRAAAQAAVRPQLDDVPPGAGAATIKYDHIDFPKSFRLSDGAAIHAAAWTGAQSLDGSLVVGRSVAVRNVGDGPARVRAVLVSVGHKQLCGWSTTTLIPAGETARLMSVEFTGLFLNPEELKNYRAYQLDSTEFTFIVEYSDISGKQRQTATERIVSNYYKVAGLHRAAFEPQDGWPASRTNCS